MLKATVALLGISLVSLSVQAGTLDHFVNIGGNPLGSVTYNGYGPADPSNLSTNGESYTIVGGGADVWDTRDEHSFAYTEMIGDFDVQVRVQSLEQTSTWQKCGIFAAEGINEGTRRILGGLTAAPGSCGGSLNMYAAWYRTGLYGNGGNSGGQHEDRSAGTGAPPFPNAWVGLTRRGNVFYVSNSSDGLTWTLGNTIDTGSWTANASGAVDSPFANRIWLGLNSMPHDSNCKPTATAEYRDLRIIANFASSHGNPHGVYVTFPNEVEPASGTVVSNYTLTGPGSPTILSAVINPNNLKQVILSLDPTKPLQEYAAAGPYTLAVAGVNDVNAVSFGSLSLPFRHGLGYEARKIHITHTASSDGTAYLANSTFYHLQQGSEYMAMPAVTNLSSMEDTFSSYPGGPAISGDGSTPLPQRNNFASTIFGLISPPANGNYRFAVASDDNGLLFMSPTDRPADAVQIANQPGASGQRNYNDSAAHISSPRALVAGQKYYLGYLWQEGGGGFNAAVTWDGPPTSGAIANGQAPIPDTYFVPSRFYFGNMFYNLGDVSILTQPASRTNQDATVATFAVQPEGTPLYTYQWLTNGTPVPGANNRTWNTPLLLPSDNNMRVQVTVGNEFSSVTSSVALLKVTVDLTPPTLVKAVADESFTRIYLTFSEFISGGTTLANYSIKDDASNPLAISAITTSDNLNFVLTTALQNVNTHYTITVNNVKDISSHQNPIAANSTISFTGWQFSPGFLHYDVWQNLGNGNVTQVTNLSTFPNSPTERYFVSGGTSRWAYPDDSHDAYGARLWGYFVPPASDNYDFYETGDDGHAFWLNQAGADFNGLGASLYDTGGNCCEAFHLCASPYLSYGNMYAMQAVYGEGGGGDYVHVWISPHTTPTPPPGGFTQTAGLGALVAPQVGAPALYFGIYANPDTAPVMTHDNLPADVTSPAGAYLTYSFHVTNSFYSTTWTNFYQWFTNGVPVPGANYPKFQTPRFPIEEDGIVVSVACSAPGRVVSSSSTVHLYIDTVPPTMKFAMGTGQMNDYSTTFDLVFDKPVDPLYAQDTFNYFLDPAFFITNVTLAVLDADGVTVHLTANYPMHDGTPMYAYNIPSLAGVPIPDGSSAIIGINWGFIRQDMYGVDITTVNWAGTIGGGNVSDLTNNAQFPNYPSNVVWLTQFESPWANNLQPANSLNGGNGFDSYGERIAGYLRVPADGDWYFWTSSDDASSLYLSTDDSPANARLIANQPSWNGYRDWSGNGQSTTKSSAITLQAGKKYFFSGFHKEGGGGDNFSVAMNQTGDTAGLVPVEGKYLSPYVDTWIDPSTPVDITTGQCGSIASTLNSRSLPYSGIIWFATVDPLTLVPTPGAFNPVAFGPTLTLPGPIPIALDGVQFYAVVTNTMMGIVTNSYSYAMSRVATLHVTPEPAPVALGASTLDQVTVDVEYARGLDLGSAQDPFNYIATLSDSSLQQPTMAWLRPDGHTVVLTFATPLGTNCILSIANVYECTGGLAINPVNLTVVQWAYTMDIAPALPVQPGGNTNFTYKPGDVEVVSGGADVWDVADQFQFVYNQVPGDFDLKVQVDRWEGPSRWAKAGLMARMTLAANSPTIQVYTDPYNSYATDYSQSEMEVGLRTDFGAGTGDWALGSGRPVSLRSQSWVRLQRVGSRFYALWSTNGMDWSREAGPQDVAFGTNQTLFVGLMACSHNTGQNGTAHFANLGTTVYAGGSVAITGQLPATTTTADGYGAILNAQVTLGGAIPASEPLTIRWQRLDSVLGWITVAVNTYTGKTVYDLSYTTIPLLTPDNGAQYRFLANAVSYSAVSTPTTINLTAAIAPKVRLAMSTNITQVVVWLDQPMNGNGEAPSWFTLSPGTFTITAVATNPANAKRFDITLDPGTPLVLGTVYTLTAQPAVQSLSGMAVDPAHNAATFTAVNFPFDPDQTTWLVTDNVLAPHTPADNKLRGFDVHIVQSGNPVLQAANDINVAEAMISGLDVGQGPNLAVIPCFVENGIINYNWEVINNVNYGHIQPDKPWPGIDVAPRFNYNDYAMEALCYLDLKAGAYMMGVNSDDGFKVTQAISGSDPHNNTVLGNFYGGRGSSDTTFNFIAPVDGLYPFRLLYEEGGGGANCEWWIQDLADGSYKAINADNGIHAYRPTTGPIIQTTPPATYQVTLTPATCPALAPDFTAMLAFDPGTVPCGDSFMVSQIPPVGSVLPVGQSTVLVSVMTPTWASNGVTVAVTVINPFPPVVLNATNTTALCSLGGAYADISYVMPGGCDPNTTLTLTPSNGFFFPLGNTPVAAVATDSTGRKTTNYFTVSVINTDLPQVICPGDQVVTCVAGATKVMWNASAISSCDLVDPTVTCVPASGSTFPPGLTAVNCSATDASGNKGTCAFNVLVVPDTEPPIFLTPCPDNMTVPSPNNTSLPVTYTPPTATDNCVADAPVVCTPPSGASFPVGTTTVNCVASDPANNKSTCSFTVTVGSGTGVKLSIALSFDGTQAVITWPQAGGTFQLQKSGVLLTSHTDPGWQNVTVPPVSVGSNWQVTVPASGTWYFQLKPM